MPDYSWSPMLPMLNRVSAALTNSGKVIEQDANGNTVLHEAFLEHGKGLVVDLLMGKYLQKTTRNLANGDGLSFLHIACTRPCVDVVRKLLRVEDVNVDCKVHQECTSIYAGYTPLHFAVKFNQREVAELLARYDANLYQQDAKGSTPLHLALECGNMTLLDLLLTHDRRRENIVNDRGLSHFMAACAGSDELIVEEYLRGVPDLQMINASVNYVAGYRFSGYTPLRLADEFERANTAQLLRDRGAIPRRIMRLNIRFIFYYLLAVILVQFLPSPLPEIFNFFGYLLQIGVFLLGLLFILLLSSILPFCTFSYNA